MSVRALNKILGKYTGGKDAIALAVANREYRELCDTYGWTPTTEGLIQYTIMINNSISWKRGA